MNQTNKVKIKVFTGLFLSIGATALVWAEPPASTDTAIQSPSDIQGAITAPVIPAPIITPLTVTEIQQGIATIKQKQDQRIETWGKNLTENDFERTFWGKQLKKPKRIEVCGILQDSINETYNLALTYKTRLSTEEQHVLEDRNAFIKSLGYKDNIIPTSLGFNCRVR